MDRALIEHCRNAQELSCRYQTQTYLRIPGHQKEEITLAS